MCSGLATEDAGGLRRQRPRLLLFVRPWRRLRWSDARGQRHGSKTRRILQGELPNVCLCTMHTWTQSALLEVLCWRRVQHVKESLLSEPVSHVKHTFLSPLANWLGRERAGCVDASQHGLGCRRGRALLDSSGWRRSAGPRRPSRTRWCSGTASSLTRGTRFVHRI